MYKCEDLSLDPSPHIKIGVWPHLPITPFLSQSNLAEIGWRAGLDSQPVDHSSRKTNSIFSEKLSPRGKSGSKSQVPEHPPVVCICLCANTNEPKKLIHQKRDPRDPLCPGHLLLSYHAAPASRRLLTFPLVTSIYQSENNWKVGERRGRGNKWALSQDLGTGFESTICPVLAL